MSLMASTQGVRAPRWEAIITIVALRDSSEAGPLARVSILFDGSPPPVRDDEPAYFADLNLDQLVRKITAGRESYDLLPFFYSCLSSEEAVAYRHEVFRDLRNDEISGLVRSFAEQMREMRRLLALRDRARYPFEKAAWFLDAAQVYCDAVTALASGAEGLDLGSRALRRFREQLHGYVASKSFVDLSSQARAVREGLDGVHYGLVIKGARVTVSRYEGEPDYSAQVLQTFEKFRRRAVKDYRARRPVSPEMDHVEGRVLDLVARLYPDEFHALDEFCRAHAVCIDQGITLFDREAQFYLAYLEFIDRLSQRGLAFCFPRVARRARAILASDAFDVALADKLVGEGGAVVCNDLYLKPPERIVVVSGPNQGGKTTFARMVGQLHYLAAIGCPVPGRDAQLTLFDRLFSHFEKEEDLSTLRGKLEDDLLRIHDILSQATAESVVVMNESLTGTTLRDATVLGRSVLEQMIERGLLCVYVTFVDELASLSEATVSMVSTVRPDDPAQRTFKIVRRSADGLAYAAAIAEKYGLSYTRLKERLTS